MERPEAYKVNPEEYEAIISERNQRLARLIKKAGSDIELFALAKSNHLIVVAARSAKSFVWLFDATSRNEAKRLEGAGLIIGGDELDLVLDSPTASIRELNFKLPEYLEEFYPELTKALPKEKQEIKQSRRTANRGSLYSLAPKSSYPKAYNQVA